MLEAKAINLTQHVVESFKEKYLRGELKPGQTLPAERELALQFEVSRVTIRDALTTLKVMGLVEVQQGKKTVVTSPTIASILQPLCLVFPTDPAHMLNILEFREILEPQCVSLATKRAAPSEVQKIKHCLDEMVRTKYDLPHFVQADFEFHQAIMQATHNEMIVAFTDVFRQILFTHQERMALLPEPEKAFVEHERVYEAILAGDPQAAADCMRELIVHTKERYLQSN